VAPVRSDGANLSRKQWVPRAPAALSGLDSLLPNLSFAGPSLRGESVIFTTLDATAHPLTELVEALALAGEEDLKDVDPSATCRRTRYRDSLRGQREGSEVSHDPPCP
jgi:hypothetical protein